MRRASEAEKRALNEQFAELCAIPSPWGREAAMGERVRRELESLGLTVVADASGNLLTRIEGRGERRVLLCAHLDTVPHDDVPIEPVVVDDGWENANDAILGADNKAAVAMLLAVARRVVVEGSPVPLELLFTVEEENALAGVKRFDASRLRSELGFVFDHATPIGEVIVASPTAYRLEVDFVGKAAHAGIRPEDGRSAIAAAARAIAAMDLGRLDQDTTANVGTIRGGVGGTNVVPERCTLLAEARSFDPARVEAVVARMVDHCQDAANEPACECDVDVIVERVFPGYAHPPDLPGIVAAEAALRDCGYEPRHVRSGGASDGNVLVAAGLPVVNLANGTERAHEATERVSVSALEGMLDVTFELLEHLRD
ncbi:MAG: M20/M25/M40 family metallo-hydrolase [Solirubrobacterales bacterium]|nr:M20/M25/M40 family metallo-hydrolase [Solirubrobacterales bacterium]